MDIKQIITDYIRRSLLTTLGDMVVRGAALPERLVAVAVGQVLKSGGVGALPAWGKPSISDCQWDIRSFALASSGDVVIADMTFTPKLFILLARDNTPANLNQSWGFDDATNHQCIRTQDNNTLQGIITDHSYSIRRDVNNYISGEVTAVAGNGFTVTSTEVGTCAIDVIVLAIG